MRIIRTTTVTITLLAVAAIGGCTSTDSGSTADSISSDTPPAADVATTDTGGAADTSGSTHRSGTGDTTSPAPAEPAETAAPSSPAPRELNAAHILVMHKDSARVPAEITRTREEALALAQELATKAQAAGADFAALAKEHSDGPSGPNGGNLGNFPPEMMVPAFTNATLKLQIGEVSAPVETQFGFHVIRRQELQVLRKASAKHILVQYSGSMRAEPSITRSKEEALERIQECLAKARNGEKFEDLAMSYSDGPSGPRGGDLGEFPEGMMHPAFEKATFDCEVGKVTDVVETPFGYHIIYRYQ